jgi:DNA-binding response OmpR family regulator
MGCYPPGILPLRGCAGRPVQEVDPQLSADDDQVIDVLLIEDDRETLEMYKLKLEKDGYRVHVAMDGEEGVRRATELNPDIVFLDIRLPKKDGFTVLEELRGQDSTADIPVIILSNYGEKELVDRGFKLGAMEFLVKAQTSPIVLSEGIDEWLKE